MILNPIPVALMILWLGIMIVLLWLDRAAMNKRLKQLERVFNVMRPDAPIGKVESYPAGTDIRAGEPVFIAEDGNVYPASLKEQRP